MASPEHRVFWPRELHVPLDKADSRLNGATGSESSSPNLAKNPLLESKQLALEYVEYQTSIQSEVTFGCLATDFPNPIKGGVPDHQAGSEESQQTLTSEDRELTQGENLSQDAYWTLNFLYSLGYTMYLPDRSEMRGIDLEAGLAELRRQGLLDESDPKKPKVIKEQLDKDFRLKLEKAAFIEREEREGGELTWGERLSKDGFWVFDYLHIGYSRHMREVSEMNGIDLDAGLEELRRQGLLDESNPDYPKVKWEAL